MKSLLLIFLTVSCFSVVSKATLDISDALTKKLEVIYKNLAPNDPQRVVISLRLADLISERARKVGQLEFDKTGAFGSDSESLRERALKIYGSVVSSLEGAQKDRVLLQMGYLSELLQDADRAQKYFSEVARVTLDQKVKGEAYLALAENFFRSRQFPLALEAYQKSLSLPIERRGYAQFRQAWTYYNLGEIEKASSELQGLLNSPESLQPVQSQSNSDVDVDFLNEVARDAATFLARRSRLSKSDVENFYKLIKRGAVDEHLQHLGFEAQRLGQMNDVILIWSFYYGMSTHPIFRSQAQSYLAEAYLALGQKEQTLIALKTSFDEWLGVSGGCHEVVCKETQKKNRATLISWYQSEKIKPTLSLLEGYQAYNLAHPGDLEMGEWMAALKGELGDLEGSQKTYFNLALSQDAPEQRERLLLLALDAAERLPNAESKQEAREKYLEHSLLKRQHWPVTYQVNMHFYNIKNFSESQVRLKEFIQSQSAPLDLRLQSAHLFLDVLAEQLLDEMVISSAAEFSILFPGNKNEFNKIKNKAALNYVKKLGLDQADKALRVLENYIDSADLDARDKLIYFKNKIVLYTHLKMLPEARQILTQMMRLPFLEPHDLVWAKTERVKLAEAAFDFEEAYIALKDIPSKTSEYYLKLSLFSEVTKRGNSAVYLTRAFELSQDPEFKKAVFFDLLEKVENPNAWIEKNLTWLQSVDSESVGRAFVVAHLRKRDDSLLKRGLIVTSKGSAWGNLIWRYQFLSDFGKQIETINKMTLRSNTDKVLQQSIRSRVSKLNHIEKLANAAIDKKDWSSQLVVLSALARENKRFYDEIMSLPIPEGLSEEESNQYMVLLSNQAKPFQQKVTLMNDKAKTLWSREGWDKEYLDILKTRPEATQLLKIELDLLAQLATDEEVKARLLVISDSWNQQTSRLGKRDQGSSPDDQLTKLREEVRASPFDYYKQSQLVQAERLAGNLRLADYLEAKLKLAEPVGGK